MLPERLSGDLCSLRPKVDRYAMAVELVIDSAGKQVDCKFHEAVIRSRARLHYAQAASVMEGQGDAGVQSAEIREQLVALAELQGKLQENRMAAGSIELELPEAVLELDADGMPADLRKGERRVSHRAVEEAMLAANRAVASAIDRAKLPGIYRVHEEPSQDAVDQFREMLETFGLSAKQRGDAVTSEEYAAVVKQVAGKPEASLINMVALRSMKQACYEDENRGHFALGFDSYTHFTSPIRRYADLVVHRVLKDLIASGKRAKGRAEKRRSGLPGVAARISMRERVAQNAEREIVQIKKCAFMKPFTGDEFNGVVTGVAKHGLYVTLDRYFVEGLIHVSELPGMWDLDEKSFSLVARRSKQRIGIGESVRVLVDRVDLLKGWINFSLVESDVVTGSKNAKTSKRRPATKSRGRGRRR